MFPARLVELPTDVLVIILRYLSARDLAALSCVSSSMHMLVSLALHNIQQ